MQPTAEQRFDDLYAGHRDDISRYCLRRLASEDAKDAVTETFLVAWRRISDVPDGDAGLLWLYRVAGNTVRNRRRSARRLGRLAARIGREPQPAAADPAAQVVRNESDRELLEALSTLSAADQEVLRLRAYEELTLDQISHVLECSVDAAKQRSSRAAKRLRAQLDKGPRVKVDPRATQKGGADGN